MKSTKTINGTYATAKIFTCANPEHELDDYAAAQLQMLCDNPVSQGCKIRIMPDVHPGKVGTIGLTMTVGERVMPNIVGIDIGCGMTMAEIGGKRVEFQNLTPSYANTCHPDFTSGAPSTDWQTPLISPVWRAREK